jgi:threonine/homoserine/homoserine lactone efflux protein
MANLLASIVFGAIFGLALAAPPGPMNAVIAQESVLRGWTAGFRAGLGAMTADVCFFVFSVLGVVAFIGSMPRLEGAMIGVGGVLMLWFAYGAVSDAAGGVDWDTETDDRGFRKAFALALTNPYQILFWLTAGVGMLESGRVDILAETPYVGDTLSGTLVVETGTPALVVGFFIGITLWIVGFPASLVAAGQRLDRLSRAIAYLSAIVLAGFGMWFLADAATRLL